jgi:hypothetical protein
MSNKIYLRSINLVGENSPSWSNIPDECWQNILKNFFYKISDRFGLSEVSERSDLFPIGLNYFKDWDLKEVDLIEYRDEIILLFELNESCKLKFQDFDFSVHSKGMYPLRSYRDFDIDHFYYEFDELYFYSGNRLVGIYINHEGMLEFINLNQFELELLNQLNEEIKKDIIDTEELSNAYKKNKASH